MPKILADLPQIDSYIADTDVGVSCKHCHQEFSTKKCVTVARQHVGMSVFMYFPSLVSGLENDILNTGWKHAAFQPKSIHSLAGNPA